MYRLIMSYTSHLCRETTFEVKDSEIYYKLDQTNLLWIRHWYYCMKGQIKYRVQFLRRNNCNVYILFISVERLVKLVNIQFAVVWTWPIYSFYSWDAYLPEGGGIYLCYCRHKKELNTCHKIKFSNSFTFATWWCKPFIFQILINWFSKMF